VKNLLFLECRCPSKRRVFC